MPFEGPGHLDDLRDLAVGGTLAASFDNMCSQGLRVFSCLFTTNLEAGCKP